jgi:hypothetical protein
MTRPEMVQALSAAAMEGMLELAGKASGDEVLSAMLTLAHKAVLLSVRRGLDLTSTRAAVEQIWALLPAEKPHA